MMMHHRTLAMAAAVVGAACSSNQGYQPPSRVTLAEGEGTHIERSGEISMRDSLAAPPARALSALTAAYTTLGFQVNVVDPRALTVGVQNQKFVRRVGGTALSKYFDCGSTLTGRRADSWYVFVTSIAQLTPVGQGSRVQLHVDALTQDQQASSDRLPCGSTGELEAGLLAEARRALGEVSR